MSRSSTQSRILASDQSATTPRKYRRRTLKFLARLALYTLCEFRVEGRENLPKGGPLIMVSNHFHFGDPAAIIHVAPWPVEFIGDDETPNAPVFLSWIRNFWGFIRINRGGASLQGLRKATRAIRQGAVLYVAPEAGSWAPILRPPRFGVSFLAVNSGAQILPLGLIGLNDIFPSLWRGRRAQVTVRIGAPFGPFESKGSAPERRRHLNQIGQVIMQRIADLLPEEKRGVYSSDPDIRRAAQRVAAFPWDVNPESE